MPEKLAGTPAAVVGTPLTYNLVNPPSQTTARCAQTFGVAAFVNHSCKPNCETDQIGGKMWIIALRDIQPGEELTYDYNLFDGEEDAPCRCGAKRCRGSLYSSAHLRKIAKKRAKKAAAAVAMAS